MAKEPTFNFGANAKPKKAAAKMGGKKAGKKSGRPRASWAGYVRGGSGSRQPFVLPV